MKKILFFCALIVRVAVVAYGADTLHVITHDKLTIVTDPATGFNAYKHWGVFPDSKTPIRKIILHVKFACPDSMRCADWDYLDIISIKRAGGANNPDKDFEIARMLTPYGGAFNKDWKFDWELEVTDFSLLLRDSVEIEYNHSGYEPNKDRGWKVTLDFEIISGRPVAIPINIQKIYNGRFLYGDSANSIENSLVPVKFYKLKNADFAKLKISQTGHGANPPDGCGEFCSKMREIFFNGVSIDKKDLWKKCSDNPLYPQAGTWLTDRAYWCPGYLQIPDDYLLPLENENNIDINMEPYVFAKTEAAENIAAYLIQYKKNTAANDVSIQDIIVPTDKKLHLRKNAACSNASIVVKNNGNNLLKSLAISYGTNSFPKKQYHWQGELAFNQQTTIQLPGDIESGNEENYFTVALSKPNNKADEFAPDNSMTAHFYKTPVHENKVVMVFKTNNQPQHNSYSLQSSTGAVLYKRQLDSTRKNKLLKDTFNLLPGCYRFMVTDTAGDGTESWFNSRGGSGYVRLQDVKGNLLKQFEADFGDNILYNFSVSEDSLQWSKMNAAPGIVLYPTRTTGSTTLEYFNGKAGDVLVQIITDEGNILVEEHQYKNLKEGVFTYDLSYRPAQRYYLKVLINGEVKYNKRIRVIEKQINFR